MVRSNSSLEGNKQLHSLRSDEFRAITARTKHRIWKKMFEYFVLHREEFLEHYHKRSNAETVFHMIKSKFGNSVKAKKGTGMINEVLVKCLCHNICVLIQETHEIGINLNLNKQESLKVMV